MAPSVSLARPGVSVAVLFGLGFAFVAFAVAMAPDAAAFGAWLIPLAAVFRFFPGAAVLVYAVVEPFQSLLVSTLPALLRYMDEAVVLVLAAVVLLPRFLREPRRFLSDPFVRLMAAFVLWGAASALYNGVPPGPAVLGLFVTVDYWLLFLVLRFMPGLTTTSARGLVLVTLAGAVLACGAGVAQHLFRYDAIQPWQFMPREGDLLRVPSLFAHPNEFGYFMLHASFLAVGVALSFKNPLFKIAMGICFAGVLMSVSRSAWFALFAGLTIGAAALNRQLLKPVLALVVAASLLMGPFFIQGVSSRLDKIAREGGDARLTYFRQALPIVRNNVITGVGPGRFGGEIAHRYGSPVHKRYGLAFEDNWTTVDSFWLHLLVECGVPGIALFAALMVLVVVRSRRVSRDPEIDPWVRALAVAMPMLCVAHVVINFTSMAFEANTSAGFFWLIAGAVFAQPNVRAGERAASSPSSVFPKGAIEAANGGPAP